MRRLLAITSLAVLAACSPGEDDSAAKSGPPAPPENAITAALRDVFRTIDADGNGRMTPVESDAFAENQFLATDGDNNRQISPAEWKAFGFGLASLAQETGKELQYEGAKAELFMRWDADRDGRLSRDEFRVGLNTGYEKADQPTADGATELTFEEYVRSPHVRTFALALS